MKLNWFSYDPEDGISFHETEDKARAAAEHTLELERDAASEGWSENVEAICWGRVLGSVVETGRRPVQDGDDSCVDEIVNYELKEH